jgi:hypothetical protein
MRTCLLKVCQCKNCKDMRVSNPTIMFKTLILISQANVDLQLKQFYWSNTHLELQSKWIIQHARPKFGICFKFHMWDILISRGMKLSYRQKRNVRRDFRLSYIQSSKWRLNPAVAHRQNQVENSLKWYALKQTIAVLWWTINKHTECTVGMHSLCRKLAEYFFLQ